MTGLLPQDGVARALAALQRFRVLCDTMGIRDVRGVATAAVRDAANGAEFLSRAEGALGHKIELLSGEREARLSALGVISSIYRADGVVGDLGGGSLELTDVRDGRCGRGVTLPLGGLSLMDLSERSPKKAAKIVRERLSAVKALKALGGRTFYAVGGTWRALARLHMRQRQYPINVMHNYVIPWRDALEFAALVERIEADALLSIESVSSARRPLLAYGAAVLEEIIRQSSPKEIVVSVLGVREGLIYSRLTPKEQDQDPLILTAREFNQLRSRAPEHGEELYAWTSRLIEFELISRRTATTGVCATPPACCPIFPGARIPTIVASWLTIWWPTRLSSASTIPRARSSPWRLPTGMSLVEILFRRSRARS